MKQFRKLVGPYCFWLFVLTVVPMLLIMIYAFVQKGNTITTFYFYFKIWLADFTAYYKALAKQFFFLFISQTSKLRLYPLAARFTSVIKTTEVDAWGFGNNIIKFIHTIQSFTDIDFCSEYTKQRIT